MIALRAIVLIASVVVLLAYATTTPAPTAVEALPVGAASFTGGTHPVTAGMVVNANFYATGSPYWNGGIHGGTDYALVDGEPAYYPFACTYLASGYYADPGRRGYYAMCTLDDGMEFYAGHFKALADYATGEHIPAGSIIGWGDGTLAHTHVQLRRDGELIDFEAYYNNRGD